MVAVEGNSGSGYILNVYIYIYIYVYIYIFFLFAIPCSMWDLSSLIKE